MCLHYIFSGEGRGTNEVDCFFAFDYRGTGQRGKRGKKVNYMVHTNKENDLPLLPITERPLVSLVSLKNLSAFESVLLLICERFSLIFLSSSALFRDQNQLSSQPRSK